MSHEEALEVLEDIRQAMHEQFPGNPARLEQLDSSLKTAGMAIDHLHDEEVRHEELVARVQSTPRGLPAEDPRNLVAKHGHQLRPGVLETL